MDEGKFLEHFGLPRSGQTDLRSWQKTLIQSIICENPRKFFMPQKCPFVASDFIWVTFTILRRLVRSYLRAFKISLLKQLQGRSHRRPLIIEVASYKPLICRFEL